MPPAPERSLRATINQLMAPERSGADLAGRVVEGEETARVPPEAAVAPPEPAAPTEPEAAAVAAPTEPGPVGSEGPPAPTEPEDGAPMTPSERSDRGRQGAGPARRGARRGRLAGLRSMGVDR